MASRLRASFRASLLAIDTLDDLKKGKLTTTTKKVGRDE